MSVSSNSVSYRLLLLSLFLTPFLLSGSNALKTSYSCIKQKDKKIIAFFAEKEAKDNVDKIYADGKEAKCSTENKITGTGSTTDPYSAMIDVSTDKDTCGVVTGTGEIRSITFIISPGAGKIVTSPNKLKCECDFANVKMESSVDSAFSLKEENAKKVTPSVIMAFVGSTPYSVGDDISLKLILDVSTDSSLKNKFKGIKPYKCWATKSATDSNKVSILDNYCAVSSAPVSLVFAPDANDKTISKSEDFKAFRFFDSNTLFITCQVDLCANAANCAKDGCTRRKKRSVNDQPTHLVSTNASIVIRGKGSSLL